MSERQTIDPTHAVGCMRRYDDRLECDCATRGRAAPIAGAPVPLGTFTPTATVQPYEEVQHPPHYGNGPDDPYEVRKVLRAWGLENDALLWNVVKYVARAGKKPGASKAKDLKKAQFYLNDRLDSLEESKP